MLASLGYDIHRDIASKLPVQFKIHQGKRGRKPEADLVVFGAQPHVRATSLITIEAKHPNESLESGKEQAESYAQNLRTPLIFYCNGHTAQIWQLQLTSECKLLLEVTEGKYSENRGKIESLLSKEAAIDLCQDISFKDYNVALRDLSRYELNEIERLSDDDIYLERSLYIKGDASNKKYSLGDLIFASGNAVIEGKSGFGKTVLSNQICIEALEQRFEGKKAPLPVVVSLPDVSFSNQNIIEYIIERIAAHEPSVKRSNLGQLVAEQGLLVVADSLNRLSSPQQRKVIAEMNATIRDNPKIRFIVLSNHKPADSPTKAICLELREFDVDDLHELHTLHSLSRAIWYKAPTAIYAMAKIPVLANQIIKGYKRNGIHFQKIDELFKNWINDGLSGASQIEAASITEILEQISLESRDHSITLQSFQKLIENGNFDPEFIEKVLATGLVVVEEKSVSLVHETLAAYFRSIVLVGKSIGEIEKYIEKYISKENHLFGSVLMALASDIEKQKSIWLCLMGSNFIDAISCLRYRADLTCVYNKKSSSDRARQCLTEIFESIVKPTDEYFSSHIREIYYELDGEPILNIGISGKLYDDPDGVCYSFFDSTDCDALVEVTSKHFAQRNNYYETFGEQGLRVDSGRIIGLRRLHKVISKLIQKRSIKGSRIWLEERCLGRFRYLNEALGYPMFGSHVELQKAIELLKPDKDDWADDGYVNRATVFQIQDLILDLQDLLKLGASHLESWWLLDEQVNLSTNQGRKLYAEMVDTYFKRSQLLYYELVSSFPKLEPYMRGVHNRPHKHFITVVNQNDSRVVWGDYFLPVEDWDLAGAEVSFSDTTAGVYDMMDNKDLRTEYLEALEACGRSTIHLNCSIGIGVPPDFSGTGKYLRGMKYETAAMSLAMEWFKQDIDYIFSELPSREVGIKS